MCVKISIVKKAFWSAWEKENLNIWKFRLIECQYLFISIIISKKSLHQCSNLHFGLKLQYSRFYKRLGILYSMFFSWRLSCSWAESSELHTELPKSQLLLVVSEWFSTISHTSGLPSSSHLNQDLVDLGRPGPHLWVSLEPMLFPGWGSVVGFQFFARMAIKYLQRLRGLFKTSNWKKKEVNCQIEIENN